MIISTNITYIMTIDKYILNTFYLMKWKQKNFLYKNTNHYAYKISLPNSNSSFLTKVKLYNSWTTFISKFLWINKDPFQRLTMDFVIGGLAGAGATVFTNPIDVVKTRMQLQGELQPKNQQVSSAFTIP